MLVAGELAHVRAHLGDHHQRGGHVDAVDAREVHATHLEELSAQYAPGEVILMSTGYGGRIASIET